MIKTGIVFEKRLADFKNLVFKKETAKRMSVIHTQSRTHTYTHIHTHIHTHTHIYKERKTMYSCVYIYLNVSIYRDRKR